MERYPNKAVVELSVLNEFLRTVIAIDPHHADKLFKVVTQPYVVARNRPLLLQVAEGLYRARWHGLYGIGYTHAGTADDVLKRSIADPDARVRAVALRSMGVSDPTRFHSLAVKALNDISAECAGKRRWCWAGTVPIEISPHCWRQRKIGTRGSEKKRPYHWVTWVTRRPKRF